MCTISPRSQAVLQTGREPRCEPGANAAVAPRSQGQGAAPNIRLLGSMGVYIVVIILTLVVVATGIALWWWRLSARIAPYEDELERQRARAAAPPDEQVVVVSKRAENR